MSVEEGMRRTGSPWVIRVILRVCVIAQRRRYKIPIEYTRTFGRCASRIVTIPLIKKGIRIRCSIFIIAVNDACG